MFKSFEKTLMTFFRRCTAMQIIGFIAALLLGAVLLHMVINWVAKSSAKEAFKGRKELLLLHMEGCPHCETLMPEWNDFKSKNDTGIATKEVERKEDPALVKKHGVTGFPAILLVDGKGDKIEAYEGPRTSAGLLEFCRAKA